MDDPNAFVKSIEAIPGALTQMSYEESWDFIRKRGGNSISRHTNISVLFRDLTEYVCC